MKFTKMHGTGNDYVYVNGFDEQLENPAQISRRISDRHMGIGSDGLIIIKPSKVADFFMEMYNADGSQSEMCGNGIRCVGKYVYDKGMTDKTSVEIETLAGIKRLELNVKNGMVETVQVNMGNPILVPKDIPVLFDGESCISRPLMVENQQFLITCVSMGNPHAIVFVDEPEKIDINRLGPAFEYHESFPNRINAEFIHVIDRKTIQMRVWERGSGETLACGTGSCAAAVASCLNDFTDEDVTVLLRGGELQIRWDRSQNIVFLTGAAKTVFEGEITL